MRPDTVFHALSDPTRRRILKLLQQGEMAAGEIGQRFEMTGPSMSHHFSVLKQADLIAARRNGQQIYYSVNTTVLQDLTAMVMDLFSAESEEGTAS